MHFSFRIDIFSKRFYDVIIVPSWNFFEKSEKNNTEYFSPTHFPFFKEEIEDIFQVENRKILFDVEQKLNCSKYILRRVNLLSEKIQIKEVFIYGKFV